MIKELTDNPDKEFISSNDISATATKSGQLKLGRVSNKGDYNFLGLEWKEVEEPVDFMTAFKAWHDEQKTIRHEREWENEIITVTKFNGKNEYANFGAGLILSGKWYIED